MKYLINLAIIISFLSCNSSKRMLIIHGIPGVVKVTGDTIYLKSGLIRLSQTIDLPSNVVLKGNNTTFVFDYNFSFPLMKLNGIINSSLIGIDFKGETLDLKRSSKEFCGQAERNWFVQIWNCKNITIDNCNFINSYGTVIHSMDNEKLYIKNSSFKEIGLPTPPDFNYSYDAIFLGAYKFSSDIFISKCKFHNIGKNFPPGNGYDANDGDGIHIQASGEIENVNIRKCIFEKCGSRGVKIQSGSKININDNEFIDCYTSVVMAIVKPIYDIDLSNNYSKNSSMVFSSETSTGSPISIYNLNISNNTVIGYSSWFMRTGGSSNIVNGTFQNNYMEESGTHVFAGRFYKSKITNNKVDSFGSLKYVYEMALEIAPECYDLLVENNYFGKFSEVNYELKNYSKNKSVVIRNNTVEMSRTKREKK